MQAIAAPAIFELVSLPEPSREVLVMQQVLLAAFILLLSVTALAHVNDRGMDYSLYKDYRGISCCNNADCRPAEAYVDTVVNGLAVVRLLIDGHWISTSRFFVVADDATDGRAHWCGPMVATISGGRAPVPRCLILPPRNT
jgi:hypothetical protein